MTPRDPPDLPADTAMDRATERPPRRGGGWLLALGALILLTTGLAYGAQGYYSRNRETAAVAEQARDFVPKVRGAAVRPSGDIVHVSLPATTTAYDVATIFARASGYIEKREADIGDKVKKGQLLAKIAVPELDDQILQAQATLGQLKAALRQAQANLDLAKVTWQRDNPLVIQGWITKQQGTIDVQTLKAQEAAVGVAQANVNAQQDQLRVLNQQQAYQQVVAPFDGIITQRNIDIGSLVQADTTNSTFLFTIMQGDVIRAQVFVPQDLAVGVTPGVKATVQVPEIPGRTFPGTVTRIADALAPGTRTLLTEIDIPNPDGALTPGTYCTVELQIPRKTPSFSVPADALIFNADGLQVAVVEDGVAHIRKISVARDLGTEVEVRDGVKQGDLVILNPPVELAEGSKVQISPAAAGIP
ncbi:efflux RND transporter periplasmic adaptor subunit [Mesorhizobium calcicola]|uniref:Efflux RND transporter periplasmic adaptor subunit n=1 Tax=Mesorhizobium calcicola TaxID=1300310 RepID=A0ABW4WFT0_9HYPH